MIDLGQESDLRRCHWVLFWEEQFELEHSLYHTHIRSKNDARGRGLHTLERAALWPFNNHIKVSQVIFMRYCLDSRCRVCNKTFCFLKEVAHDAEDEVTIRSERQG